MYEDKLVEIPVADWVELRDLYKLNWPQNEIAYCTIENYMAWKEKEPDMKDLKVCSLNGSWRENGTYIIRHRYEMYIYTLEESNDTLRRALNLVDWSFGFKICSIRDYHVPPVLELIEANNYELEFNVVTHIFYMTKEDVLKMSFELPEGVHLRKLEARHAHISDKVWPHRCCGSLEYLQKLAVVSDNVGVFNDDDELMAWCYIVQTGALGVLQVDEKFFKKGYGTIVTKAAAKVLADKGYNSYGFVVDGNTASVNMFSKIGFQNVGHVNWIKLVPTKKIDWTDSSKSHY